MKIIIDMNELMDYIANKTGLDLTTILTILETEEQFLKLKGVIR